MCRSIYLWLLLLIFDDNDDEGKGMELNNIIRHVSSLLGTRFLRSLLFHNNNSGSIKHEWTLQGRIQDSIEWNMLGLTCFDCVVT